jgi:dihydroflavonol-4-reductase
MVLVTGATGFIGSALCRALIREGRRVRALHRPTSDLRAIADLPLERYVGDILDPQSLAPCLAGVDLVFHAAAQSAYWREPQAVLRTAIEGTINVMRAAQEAGVSRAVLTSSIAAMGVPERDELLTEQHYFNLPARRFPYGYAKRQSEIEALKLADRGLEVVVVNPTIVLGPGDLNQISGSMVIEAARGWGFFWIDGGANYVHIQDAVRGHLAAAELGRPGERYILGGENLPHREVFTSLAEIVGRRPPWMKIPSWSIEPAARLIDALRLVAQLPFDAGQLRISRHRLFCDLSKSQRQLKLPEPLPLRQAAQETYAWYREQGVIETQPD